MAIVVLSVVDNFHLLVLWNGTVGKCFPNFILSIRCISVEDHPYVQEQPVKGDLQKIFLFENNVRKISWFWWEDGVEFPHYLKIYKNPYLQRPISPHQVQNFRRIPSPSFKKLVISYGNLPIRNMKKLKILPAACFSISLIICVSIMHNVVSRVISIIITRNYFLYM